MIGLPMKKIVKNSLGYDNSLFVYQDKQMFNYSVDTILLGNFATLNASTQKVLEIGTNNAALALFLAARSTKIHVDALEIQPEALQVARQNVTLNQKEQQITLIEGDFNDYWQTYAAKPKSSLYDLIVVNPPFYKPGTTNLGKISPSKLMATHEVSITLEDIIGGSAHLLKKNAYLALVIATERLVDVCHLMRQAGFEVKRVQFVHPRTFQKSNLVLVEGRYQAGWGTHFLPNLYLHPDDLGKSSYRPEVVKLYRPIKVNQKDGHG
ncbi:uncharacterized protein LOC111615396 [Centruroides sculpturatus]|uniref:uncharacterized protein LOC111615396 n=1 Tax=Centruroides sculpturatus TaxID=218467 RepID=UPI000C6CBDD0|nr:uncharacterized protein LOC111615396 [Centruroides sculpturatus]